MSSDKELYVTHQVLARLVVTEKTPQRGCYYFLMLPEGKIRREAKMFLYTEKSGKNVRNVKPVAATLLC